MNVICVSPRIWVTQSFKFFLWKLQDIGVIWNLPVLTKTFGTNMTHRFNKLLAEEFLSKSDQIRKNCRYGNIFWRNLSWKTSIFVQSLSVGWKSQKLLLHNSYTKMHMLLNLSWRRSLSYRNQPIDMLCKSMYWFLYDSDLCRKRVKMFLTFRRHT